MRKTKLMAMLGTMLLASVVPSALQAKTKKSTQHTSARTAKAGSHSAASGKSKSKGRTRRSRSSRRDTSWRRGQKGPTPDRILEIQQALARQGAYTGQPSGKWDAQTVEAMRRFQTSRSLNPTGKLDALTLQKLGLGSDIAGLAPPQAMLPDGPLASRRAR